jgi:hypothetical protein
MIPMKTLGLAVGIAFAASSFAFAQQGNAPANAAASGGAGTHQNSLRTGSGASTQKVQRNQQGYRRQAARVRSHPKRMRMQVLHHPVTGKRLKKLHVQAKPQAAKPSGGTPGQAGGEATKQPMGRP